MDSKVAVQTRAVVQAYYRGLTSAGVRHDVRGLGPMRVAEHFTVRGEQITRLRQIHDTVAVRAADLEKKP